VVLVLIGQIAARGDALVVHVLNALERVHPAQMAPRVQPRVALLAVQELCLEQQDHQAEAELKGVFDDFQRGPEWRIRQQHIAAFRALRHVKEIEYSRIRTAAILNIAGVHGDSSLPHHTHEIAQATERLADGLHAGQQWFVREQGFERDRRRVELVQSAFGLRATEARTLRLTHPSLL
jgi:hypothetical protein